ncbi:MAG TPA: MATE family efflux transporter [Polyangiaceae bacterium]|nr:MATE family efflux transporter [Polyangiaceae bacterium]
MNQPRRRHRSGSSREMVAVALPMVVSLSCDTVMTFTDRLFVSNLGSSSMNAVFAGGLAAFAAQTFFAGLIGYSTALVGQLFGAKQPQRCIVATYQALIVALLAWPLLWLLIPVGHTVFPRLGLPAAQLNDQIRYFELLMLGAGLGLIRGAFSAFFSGLGRTWIVMAASLCSMVTNVGLVWVLVFGKFGMPAMGVAGAAVGTLTASALGVLVLAFAFFSRTGARQLAPLPRFRVDGPLMRELLRKGTPSGAEFFLNLFAFQAMVLLFQRQGEVSATAATIMFNWDMVSFVPLVGVEVGVTSLVGRYVGANNRAAVRRSIRSGMQLGWYFSGFVLVAFIVFPEVLVDIFSGNPPSSTFLQGRTLAINMVRIASAYVTFEAVLLVFSGALRGAGDTFFTMLATTGMHWTLVLALWVTLEFAGLSTLSGWIVLVAVFFLFPLVLGWRWKKGYWRRAVVA